MDSQLELVPVEGSGTYLLGRWLEALVIDTTVTWGVMGGSWVRQRVRGTWCWGMLFTSTATTLAVGRWQSLISKVIISHVKVLSTLSLSSRPVWHKTWWRHICCKLKPRPSLEQELLSLQAWLWVHSYQQELPLYGSEGCSSSNGLRKIVDYFLFLLNSLEQYIYAKLLIYISSSLCSRYVSLWQQSQHKNKQSKCNMDW